MKKCQSCVFVNAKSEELLLLSVLQLGFTNKVVIFVSVARFKMTQTFRFFVLEVALGVREEAHETAPLETEGGAMGKRCSGNRWSRLVWLVLGNGCFTQGVDALCPDVAKS